MNINDVISSPEIIISQPNCVTNSGTITVASQASFYSFDNGLTWNTSNILSGLSPDTYYIKIKNSDNCISPATMATINAFTNYPETPSGVTPQFFCGLEDVTISNLIITGQNITWYNLNNGGIQLSNSTLLQNGVTYYASQNIDGCESQNRLPVEVNISNPIEPTFDALENICYGQLVQKLPDSSLEGITGTWNPTIINNTFSETYIFTPLDSECATTSQISIEVNEDFDFEIKQNCLNGHLILSILPINFSFNLYDVSFEWSTNLNSIGNNSESLDITEYLNSTTITENLPITFDVLITNSLKCEKSKSITISKLFCEIPKGISPNGDELNDFWDLSLLNIKHLTIYNRYGTKVYSKDNYLKEWNGKTDDGKELPTATYYYYIEFNDNSASKTGWVYLNR